jgi:hypothetical protein
MQDQSERPTAPIGSGGPLGGLTFLGPAALVTGERPAAYDELLARISSALKPADILEDIWIRDIVDLVWEGFRLRHLKAQLMTDCARDGVERVLWTSLREKADKVSRKWAIHDEEAVATVRAALATASLSLQGATAWKTSVKIADFERLDRMITALEARRHNALRELDRHRASLAQRLRRAIAEVEGAELPGVRGAEPAPAAT